MKTQHIRTIHSFVKREGRLTTGQQLAIDTQWPEFGINYSEEKLNFTTLFDNEADVILEIGFGNGDSLWQMAQAQPEKNYFGIEVHRPGVGHLLRLVEQTDCKNIRVSNHDAIDVLEHQIPDNSIDRLQLFFPDPWHKKKHNKRRIVQEKFINQVARILKPDGIFHLATDWEHYAKHMLSTLNDCDLFNNLSDDNTYVPKPEERPTTKFEKRGHRLGHGVWDLLFQKK
ncbi:MAG: tRNA (guanosine(46)-N7)-methyltransferase TrmB [endosymbiont of Galathealinum brachiosum]|uniref:tRNA (guanine-N(7)-)-methyltransferase n=1 Tax=endosymbiont of Galathealinum brachiosum TaxID=2200906 RepID=A0A370DE65_9GAMM|nr:MAG: tRNA (guanosine(46)-N7)-methyltransferase TrmB [endosymbiont of Galathealinum brachiosum]